MGFLVISILGWRHREGFFLLEERAAAYTIFPKRIRQRCQGFWVMAFFWIFFACGILPLVHFVYMYMYPLYDTIATANNPPKTYIIWTYVFHLDT